MQRRDYASLRLRHLGPFCPTTSSTARRNYASLQRFSSPKNQSKQLLGDFEKLLLPQCLQILKTQLQVLVRKPYRAAKYASRAARNSATSPARCASRAWPTAGVRRNSRAARSCRSRADRVLQ